MPALHVRNVPDPLYEKLRARAEREGRSINGEAIAILEEALSRPSPTETRVLMQRAFRRRRPAGVFERFTERGRRAVAQAQEEARALGHPQIRTEHLLLGLFDVELGLAARILASLGIARDEVRRRIVDDAGEGHEPPAGPIPFSPAGKRTLELALRESLALGCDSIGTEHILLGVLQEEGVGGRVLRDLGAELEVVREAVAAALRGAAPGPAAVPFEYPFAPGWAYRLEDLREPLEDALRELERSARGWELVAVVGEPPAAKAILKRPAP